MIHSKTMGHPVSSLVLAGALVAVSVGCKREEEPPPVSHPTADSEPPSPAGPRAPSGAPATTAPTAGAAADPDLLLITIIGIDLDTRLAEICKLPGSSVFFKFDSAKLNPEAKERLQQIAECATRGPAKGNDLVIIGRTDPSGGGEYNQKLGMSRAESVARYLRGLGVLKARVETESRGEAAAMQEPFGWPLERRVTVRLQQP